MTDASELDLRHESILSVGANLIIVSVQFAMVVLLARALGVSDLGVYYFTLAISSIVSRIPNGIGNVIRKRVSEEHAAPRELVGVWTVTAILWLTGIAVLAILFDGYLVDMTDITHASLSAGLLIVFSQSVFGFATRLYDGLGRPGASMWVQAIRDAAFIPLILFVQSINGGSTEMLYAYGALSITAGLALLLFLRVLPRIPSKETVVNAYTFARYSIPEDLLFTINARLPILVLGTFVGSSAVGLFESAKRLTKIGPYVATCVNDPLLVKVSGKSSKGEATTRLVNTAMSYTPVFAAPMFALSLALGPEILAASYSSEFATAGIALALIALARVFYTLWSPLDAALKGADEPKESFVMQAIRTVILAASLLALVPLYGVSGAAVAFLIGEIAPFLILTKRATRVFPDLSHPRLLNQLLVATGVTAISAAGVYALFPGEHLIELFVAIGVGVVTYVAALLATSSEIRIGVQDFIAAETQ